MIYDVDMPLNFGTQWVKIHKARPHYVLMCNHLLQIQTESMADAAQEALRKDFFF
jgi:hypothetical protein